jgi:hypothetical protein
LASGERTVIPSYDGRGLVNLMAEVETRLTGSAPSPPLHPELARRLPEGTSYVVVLFDGLGHGQLAHAAASRLAEDEIGSLDAPFPSTTTVSLATISTGLPPSQHGLLGYQLWLPPLTEVVNTIKWTTLWGVELDYPTSRLLPSPNLWERLTRAGKEPITVQPGHLAPSQLSRALYRGCRIEPAFTIEEVASATITLGRQPGRLIMAYLPHVDFAAHVFGQDSPGYEEALTVVASVWDELARGLPDETVLIGTADHGHIDFPAGRQVRIPKALEAGLTLYGDTRAMFVKGDGSTIAGEVPAGWLAFDEVADWWGPAPLHPRFHERAPDGVLLADDGYVILHTHSDKRLTGHHGGLDEREKVVPLLVG